MEMTSKNEQNAGVVVVISLAWCWFKGGVEKLMQMVIEFGRKAKKLGQEDPRRIVHSLKVGLAITLVSLFYYFDSLYHGFGVSSMWAVMTVVVVFEFSVGATVGRGLNRGIATLLAGALAVGAHNLATLSGDKVEPIILGLSVFLLAAVVTFMRFIPTMKARYDYGLLIFILTFSLISVSAYRDDEVLEMAHQRLSTILIGGATAVVTCFVICPVWAGEDFHNLVSSNIEKLANFLQGFGSEYFNISEEKLEGNNEFLQQYRSVLNSKSTEESLANFAKWEPRHGQFRYRHPWEQYLEVGTLIRQCANLIDALNGYLNSEIQVPLVMRAKIQETYIKMSSESSNALKELALAMKTMTWSPSVDSHMANTKMVVKELKSLLKTSLWQDTDLVEIIPVATVASLLIDVVNCTEKIAESVKVLASLAHFKGADAAAPPEQPKLARQQFLPCSGREATHHIINIGVSSTD